MFFVDFCRRIKDKHGRKTSFLILLSFMASFMVARTYAFFAAPSLIVRGIHIHHLNYGIFFLAVAGFLSFYFSNSRFRNKVIVLYGIGLGLTFDQFAMWLHLDDDYWMGHSYTAVIVIAAFLINAAIFGDFWLKIFGRTASRAATVEDRYKEIVRG